MDALVGSSQHEKSKSCASDEAFRPFATAEQELPKAKNTWRCCWAGSPWDAWLLYKMAAIPPKLMQKSTSFSMGSGWPQRCVSAHPHSITKCLWGSMLRVRIPPNPALIPEIKDTPNTARSGPSSQFYFGHCPCNQLSRCGCSRCRAAVSGAAGVLCRQTPNAVAAHCSPKPLKKPLEPWTEAPELKTKTASGGVSQPGLWTRESPSVLAMVGWE